MNWFSPPDIMIVWNFEPLLLMSNSCSLYDWKGMSWDISFKHRDEFLLIVSTEKDAAVSVVYTLYSSFVGLSALFLVWVLSFIPHL
jgi:hypothetical protein